MENMKQLLTYISPDKDFNSEHKMAVKIQIDNSLRLGWKREDILLVTNFPYEYNGVKSIVIGSENYADHFFPATKIYVIDYLFGKGLIDGKFWYHDFDCFQLNHFNEGEPDLENCDMGLTNYGRVPRLCSASLFFNNKAGDIFKHLREDIAKRKIGEEEAIMELKNFDTPFKDRIKLLNLTYCLHRFNLWHCYNRAIRPIRAVHFHLTPDKYDFFVNGNNRVGLKIIPEPLITIFNKYGFR